MEMLLSSHLKKDTLNVMRTSYNIYGSAGFIGFCVIYHHEKTIHAHLLLFESASPAGNIGEEDHQPDSGRVYSLKTPDAYIIRDLMSAAIPSFGKNGLKYVAHNANAIHNIE